MTTPSARNRYRNFNHNGTELGAFKTKKEAEADAEFYTEQTGNPVTIRKTFDV